MKFKVDMSLDTKNVKMTGDTLTIEDVALDAVATEIANNVRAAISAQIGDKWNKTGRLLAGVKSSGSQVTVPGDRLDRDDLAQRFADEVMPQDPLTARVRKAIADALLAAIKVEKR